MAVTKKQVPETTFGQFVDAELDKRGSSRRWLMAQLKSLGINFTDTQLSNRCTGFIEFQQDEMVAIEKVLEVEFTNNK